MHSLHISRILLAVTVVMFFVSLETYAQLETTVNDTAQVAGEDEFLIDEPITAGVIESALTVELDDLQAAGFTSVTRQRPSQNAYLAPVSYFRVEESVAQSYPAWGSAANLVAVLIRPIADRSWLYNNGQLQAVDIAGRIQARLSRPGYYLVITGPDAQKVISLARLLQAK